MLLVKEVFLVMGSLLDMVAVLATVIFMLQDQPLYPKCWALTPAKAKLKLKRREKREKSVNSCMDLGHWSVNESVYLYENFFGFVYCIENLKSGKKYIGKKQCTRKVKRPPKKGKINKRIDHKESDWKTYTSSSVELNEDIKNYGKENFCFTILRVCSSKWELAYFEAKIQFDMGVLFSDKFYNGIINLRIGRPPKNLII